MKHAISPSRPSSALRLASWFVALVLAATAAGCGCSGDLVVHVFDEQGDPVLSCEARVEDAGLSRRGSGSLRLEDVPCRSQAYLVHVSSPEGHFRSMFTRAGIQDDAVVSVEVEVKLNAKGLEAKQRDKDLDVGGRIADGVNSLLGPR